MSPEMNVTSAVDADSSVVGTLLGNAIRDIGIPPCPAILDQINLEMGKDEPDLNHLTRIIGSDVGISAGLITIANSPFFGLRRRVRSVNEALMLLGLSVASRAIAGLILQKLFPNPPRLERFWHASANIARVSGWLAQQNHNHTRIRAEDAYTLGLFRDSGIPLLVKRFDHYYDVLKKANEEQALNFIVVENERCSTNHAMVGGLLAQGWWLPDEICMAIRHHHDYPLLEQGGKSVLSPATKGLIATALLAEHLVQHHMDLARTQEWHKGGTVCLQVLDLTDEDLDRLYTESATIVASSE
ncbi:MAG: HDOD domain-containing protein [Proteobacteria bacterium]|nr:HDOD domain-containing protein [Pseudomonadota bacterium]